MKKKVVIKSSSKANRSPSGFLRLLLWMYLVHIQAPDRAYGVL